MIVIRIASSAVVLLAVLGGSSLAQSQVSPIPVVHPVSYSICSEADQANERRIEVALAQRVTFDIKDMPLKELISKLADECNITIVLTKKIEDAGVTPTQPITGKVVETSLKSTLRLILGDLNLTYMVKDEVIKITTIEDACSPENMTIRIYPVLDLLEPTRPAKDGNQARDYRELIDNISTTVEPHSWQDVGGPGSCHQFDNAACLVISQRPDIHEQVERLLTTLRKVKQVQGLPKRTSSLVLNRYSAPPAKLSPAK
ncbi:hypothetical protein NA78x_001333 [Anatilimnocola sp. NA78]|uniref:hypothetical protein n=1 Tax=Anatilimnocola sp. NA78 TaxID=3415683 RepID=UPI003CE4E80F